VYSSYEDLADSQLAGSVLSRNDAHCVLTSADDDLLDLIAAAARLRRVHFGNSVKVNYLVNLKSGLCPEDCSYCSQRLGSAADVLTYSWLDASDAVAQSSAGIRSGAARVCLVASGRGPSERDIERVSEVVGRIKHAHPHVEVCACLGLLQDGQADRLKAAGVDAYNHNVNTSESRYAEICSSHDYSDRVDTVRRSQQAGLSACSGLIVGLGESDDELIDTVFALRELGSDSIPVNFLMPFDGTPLGGRWELTPQRCLRILALVRFAVPAVEIRMGGGSEMHLRSLRPLALHLANSLFLGDYLTSEGQAAQADLDMIADAGFEVLSSAELGSATGAAGGAVQPAVPIRRRGAGTELAPNA